MDLGRYAAVACFVNALLLVAGCHRKKADDVSPPSPPRPASAALAQVEPKVAIADLHSAFWTHDGTLVAVSPTRAYTITPDTCVSSASTKVAALGIIAKNGVDRFVVHDGPGSSELRSVKELALIAKLPSDELVIAGAIATGGARVALAGCPRPSPDRTARCGVLYDGLTGARVSSFSTTHVLDRLDFSDDGRYLVGRSDDAGVTVLDAATGKVVVTRPRWKKLLEVHAWNGSDLAELAGDTFVVGYDDLVEHVDLLTGKTLGRIGVPGKTMAAFGPRTGRVAVLSGAADRVTVWDSRRHAIVRTFELHNFIASGANCTHCAIELDDVDEDRVWLTSAYTDDRLALDIGSGVIERASEHVLRGAAVPSATQRLIIGHHGKTQEPTCALTARGEDAAAPRSVPSLFCNVLDARRNDWPYPGFSPDGRYLAALSEGALHVMPTKSGEGCVATR